MQNLLRFKLTSCHFTENHYTYPLMDYFNYKNGRLFAENVNVERIASSVGTPAYIYSKATFLEHLKRIRSAYKDLDSTICFSVKACSNINILKFLAKTGIGFDIVSGGELFRVIQADGDLSKTVFAGVGKTDKEITEALNSSIGCFNIESQAELETLLAIAKKIKAAKKNPPKGALRINPDVEYDTHKYIATGTSETKFGVDIKEAEKIFARFGRSKIVRLCAIHVHLGSGGKSTEPYITAVKKILPLIDKLRSDGFTIESLNLGGGYGADYETHTVPSAADYAAGIVPLLKEKNLKLVLEPGKSIAANAAILLTRVLYTKKTGNKNFIIVDTAMNDLIRPALYGAFHFIWPVKVTKNFIPVERTKNLKMRGSIVADIVGPICESADFLAKDRLLPPVKRGDLFAVFTTGAYGFAMSSNYNSRPRVAEVLVDGNKFSIIRKRETYKDLIAPEK